MKAKELNSFRLLIWRQQEGRTCLLLCVGFVGGMMHELGCRVRQLNACSLPFSWSDYKRTLLVVVIIKRGGITTALRSSFFNIASSRCASTYLPPPLPPPLPHLCLRLSHTPPPASPFLLKSLLFHSAGVGVRVGGWVWVLVCGWVKVENVELCLEGVC